MSVRFVTIVPHAENLELRKDPGQIPYQLGKLPGISTSLVTYYYTLKGGRNEGSVAIPPNDPAQQHKDYPYLLTEVRDLNLNFLPNKGRGKFYEKSIFQYLLKNSTNIDVLNLFHFNSENIFYTFLYKLLHPKGKVYLKLDIDIPFYNQTKYFFNVNGRFRYLKILIFTKLIQPAFFRQVHTISAESKFGVDYFCKRFKVPLKKMLLLPNGVDENQISKSISGIKSFGEKENIIITVGRIGTRQKNNEMLLKALTAIDLTDWKVFFIGLVEETFKPKIADFFKENPGKSDQVFFTGYINSPEVLYQYYNKSKIFCLTSIDEGFPLSACEAAFFGNYLVLTDRIYCFDELTNNGEYGKKIQLNDTDQLASSLKNLIENPEILQVTCEKIKAYAKANLTWQAIIPKLNKRLN